MDKIISFDIAAMIILVVLIFSVFYRRMVRGKENITFILFLFVTLIATVTSLITGIASKFPTYFSIPSRYILHSIYLVSRNLVAPCYCYYMVAITDTWHKFNSKKFYRTLIAFPYFLILINVLANPFTHYIFYIDENLLYVRGTGFIMLYMSAAFYIVFGLIYLCIFRKTVSKVDFGAIASIIPLTVASVVIQFIDLRIVIEMFATVMAELMMTITVQRPEEYIDSETGLRKYSAYRIDVNKDVMNKKNIRIILINVSNYTTLNSMLGYEMSNELLREITRIINSVNSSLKSHAIMYYLGEGKFRCILEEKCFDKVDLMANMINSEMKKGLRIKDMYINLLAYVSIVSCPEDISDFTALVRYGNEINKLVPYTGEVVAANTVIKDHRYYLSNDIAEIIESGLANNRFEVYYQPIYSLEKKKFASAEALLRLRDKDGRFISPDVFIPLAEKSGAIHQIGDFVINEVCRFIAEDSFKQMGIEYIEINLSVSQCMQRRLAQNIIDTMKRYEVRPEQINLEITETAASYAQNIMMENLDKLAQAGVTFSLDDYGTGYSNIQRVASLPLRIVKLDKTFVDMEKNPKMWTVLKNTVRMLKEMNMEIVVEGVETIYMVKKFAELNCEYIQGYYYSKPVPKNEFIRFINNYKCAE